MGATRPPPGSEVPTLDVEVLQGLEAYVATEAFLHTLEAASAEWIDLSQHEHHQQGGAGGAGAACTRPRQAHTHGIELPEVPGYGQRRTGAAAAGGGPGGGGGASSTLTAPLLDDEDELEAAAAAAAAAAKPRSSSGSFLRFFARSSSSGRAAQTAGAAGAAAATAVELSAPPEASSSSPSPATATSDNAPPLAVEPNEPPPREVSAFDSGASTSTSSRQQPPSSSSPSSAAAPAATAPAAAVEPFVLVERDDAVHAMAYYVALYLARAPEARNMDPKQLQDALKVAFAAVRRSRYRAVWDWGRWLYRWGAVSYSALQLYEHPWVVRAIVAGVWASSRMALGFLW